MNMISIKYACIPAAVLVFIFFSSSVISAQSYEQLESRIRQLEERLKRIETQLYGQSTQSEQTTSSSSKQNTSATTAKTSSETVSQGPTKVLSEAERTKLIRARIFKKQLNNSGGSSGMAVLIAFTNTGSSDIQSFKGTIILRDAFENILCSFLIDLQKPITSYDSESWFGEVPYDPENEGHKKLLAISAEEIKTSLEVDEIVFSNGTIKRAQ